MTACPKSKPRITVFGDVMSDRYFVGDVERLNPEAPGVVIRVDHEDLRPGGAASVAMIASSLGAEVTLAGVVGSDVPGGQVRTLLKEHGVTSHLWIAEDRPTTTKNRFVVRGQLRPDRFDCETTSEIASDAVTRLASCPLGDALLIQDYGKGVCTNWLLRSLTNRGREANIPVLVDPALGRNVSFRQACMTRPGPFRYDPAHQQPQRRTAHGTRKTGDRAPRSGRGTGRADRALARDADQA